MDERCQKGEHLWDGCVCERCLKSRHRMVGCRCEVCHDSFHDWQGGCTCGKCGEVDDERHVNLPDQCVCQWCEAVMHTFETTTCIVCGYEATEEEIVQTLVAYVTRLACAVYTGAVLKAMEDHGFPEATAALHLPQPADSCGIPLPGYEAQAAGSLTVLQQVLSGLNRKDAQSDASPAALLERRLAFYRDVSREFPADQYFASLGFASPPTQTSGGQEMPFGKGFVIEALTQAENPEGDVKEILDRLVEQTVPFILPRLREGDEKRLAL